MDYNNAFKTSPYAFHSRDNVLEEKDLGITADIASILTPWRSVFALNCFQGCPWTCTGFDLDLRVDGECVRAVEWEWLPSAILRRGSTKCFCIETLTAVVFVINHIKAAGHPLSTMGEAAKNFIANWESEKYRKSLAGKKG